MHTTPPIATQVDGLAGTMSDARSTATELGPGARVRSPLRADAGSGNRPGPDGAFVALLNAYRPHAGLVRLRSLVAGGCIHSEGHECDVEDLVDAGRLFGFQWHDALWLPVFQFRMPGPTVATEPQRVVGELGRGFDGWALAGWFVQPNAGLAGRRPIECLDSRLPDVLAAAHADGLVAAR